MNGFLGRGRGPVILILALLQGAATASLFAAEAEPDRLRAAGIVLKWIRTDREANFQRLEPLVRVAAAGGAQLVCTTECFLDGYAIADKTIPLADFQALGEPIPDGPYYQRLANLADALNITLVAGLLERDGSLLYNTAVVIAPDGRLVGKYHKQKLEHELVRVTPGAVSSVVDAPSGKLGVMICADRRDPELVAQFVEQGAELLICPSGGMFGPRRNDPIVQARSRETGKFIVFTHPAEFLVTAPSGEITQRVLLGDDLFLEPDQVDTEADSQGVYYVDFQRRDGSWEASPVSAALGRAILPPCASKEEVRDYVLPRIPDVEFPATEQQWAEQAERLRTRLLNEVMYRGEAAAWRDAPSRVEWFGTIDEGHGYRIRKFRYEAVPDFWIPGLLYEPAQLAGKMPVAINPNGHHRGGNAMPYKQRRCINLARRGVLAYSLEFIDMGQLHDADNKHNRLVQLDLCGTSGLAPFFLALTKGLDAALQHPHADPQRVAVTGLSGGGWQTILLAALDPRVTLANPVAGYCSMAARVRGDNNIGDAEQIPSDMTRIADYTHLTAMVAPRPLLLTYNAQDECCFLPEDVLPRLREVGEQAYELCSAGERFETHVNLDPGTHNYDKDNREAFYRWLHQWMLPADKGLLEDLPVPDAEIKSSEELAVPLPPDNQTLHRLAVDLSQSLPRNGAVPAVAEQQRKKLRELVRYESPRASADLIDAQTVDGTSIKHWTIEAASDWTIPVVEFTPPAARGVTILISDGGKDSLTTQVETLLAEGERVVAADLLGFGEADPGCEPGGHDDVMLMLVASVGERPLGIQASLLNAVARWTRVTDDQGPPDIIAIGPRNCLIALAGTALAPDAAGEVILYDARRSLQELIAENLKAEDAPEQFCFGLLEAFDVPQLVQLVGEARVRFRKSAADAP